MASDNFVIINIFNSLNKIVKYKIEYLYKNINFTEKLLISEKADVYGKIYDNNKTEYRYQIIKKARRKKISEYEYASYIVDMANKDNRHIGWYIFKKPKYKLRASFYVSFIVVATILLSILVAGYAGLPFS